MAIVLCTSSFISHLVLICPDGYRVVLSIFKLSGLFSHLSPIVSGKARIWGCSPLKTASRRLWPNPNSSLPPQLLPTPPNALTFGGVALCRNSFSKGWPLKRARHPSASRVFLIVLCRGGRALSSSGCALMQRSLHLKVSNDFVSVFFQSYKTDVFMYFQVLAALR